MSREIRRVPANWEHPKNERGHYVPLLEGYSKSVLEWDERAAKWEEGFRSDWNGGWKPREEEHQNMTYSEWGSERPEEKDYMPEWPDEEKTHIQMYETTSEGTPISPVMDTPENLARWLADNNASAFGGMTASYDEWLYVARGGYACSAVMVNGVLKSGVEAISKIDN